MPGDRPQQRAGSDAEPGQRRQPVLDDGDRVGVGVAAGLDRDVLAPGFLVRLGGADQDHQALLGALDVLDPQCGQLRAAAVQRVAQHQQHPVSPAGQRRRVAGVQELVQHADGDRWGLAGPAPRGGALTAVAAQGQACGLGVGGVFESRNAVPGADRRDGLFDRRRGPICHDQVGGVLQQRLGGSWYRCAGRSARSCALTRVGRAGAAPALELRPRAGVGAGGVLGHAAAHPVAGGLGDRPVGGVRRR